MPQISQEENTAAAKKINKKIPCNNDKQKSEDLKAFLFAGFQKDLERSRWLLLAEHVRANTKIEWEDKNRSTADFDSIG